ncbi:hypothetical protein DLAC_01918 [Tieghemostelium lacteum]|uniref:RING-type domain-containing protein n=1 Tax=Tieghemostelium lacteum TaxID=361077 RepID=A0A152A5C4_TIELA|nr:hypothetical protein DLAC_01918 [Tieghemostelium lacteum]|eukprot:KYR01434.1 hypothetical protein DLAC_01918 [Tieghemostelium lacteum]
MQVDIEQEVDLKIALRPFIDEITCPICFNTISSCLMTTCGHNFCSHCILECINRNHKCPCCNANQVKDQLVKNIQFDKIISIIEKEKEFSSKHYFEDLISQSSNKTNTSTTTTSNSNDNNNSTNSNHVNISPVEELFRKYLTNSILSFEGFYQDLNKKYKDNIDKLEKEHQALVIKMGSNPIIIEQSQREMDLKKSKLNSSFKNSTDLIFKSLEDYLKQTATSPGFLTIYTTISIPDKNLNFDHVPLKPTQTLIDIKNIIIEKLNSRGGDYTFVSWNPNGIVFTVEKPSSIQDNQVIKLDDDYRPLSLYGIPAGSKIILSNGGILLKGDQPKDCFVTTYKPGTNEIMNYYRCDDCQFNWICQPCADYCHKGHTLRIHIPNHKASYACCYDQRNKKCKILK